MANPTQPGIEVVSKEFKRDDNDTVLCTDRVEVKFDGVTLGLAQSWENGEELAPIFSGACWAGTVVWQAALDLCDYMSEHHRSDLVGASVVELGCGIGVPGMIARLLGANVVLTEQDELLSLLDKNLAANFKGDRGEGIRYAALDWERKADTDDILASLKPRAAAQPGSSSSGTISGGGSGIGGSAIVEIAAGGGGAETLLGDSGAGEASEAPATVSLVDPSVQHPPPPAPPSAVEGGGGAISCEGQGEGAAERRPPTQLEFVLCADCVFEPLYGDSWKALAKVMGRLSDAGTTVLCSVERRGDDGVPRFLDACEAEGFERRMVYRSAPGAPAPIELYELSKGGQQGFRGVAVESDDVNSLDVDNGGDGGDGDDQAECSPPGEEADSTKGGDDVIGR